METILTVKEKPNSYVFGKIGNRLTLFFNTPEELKVQLDELKKMGLYKDGK